MSVYSINYDLKNGDSTDYSKLYQAIQSYENWAHPLESTWLIRTTKSSEEIFEHLRPFTHKNDLLFVILSVLPNSQYQLFQKDIDWINANNFL